MNKVFCGIVILVCILQAGCMWKNVKLDKEYAYPEWYCYCHSSGDLVLYSEMTRPQAKELYKNLKGWSDFFADTNYIAMPPPEPTVQKVRVIIIYADCTIANENLQNVGLRQECSCGQPV